jgi:hypothetical protein
VRKKYLTLAFANAKERGPGQHVIHAPLDPAIVQMEVPSTKRHADALAAQLLTQELYVTSAPTLQMTVPIMHPLQL